MNASTNPATSTEDTAAHSRRHWHLEKNISVGHIITTIAIAGSVFLWAMKMDTRVAILETRAGYTQKASEKADTRWTESINRLEATLIRIETKLDNKQDKRK